MGIFTDNGKYFLKNICIFTAFVFCISTITILIFQFPIYTDDINYIILNTRYWIDGNIRSSIFSTCPNNGNGVGAPWPILIGLIINSSLTTWLSSPSQLRILTIFLFFLWLALLYHIRRQLEPTEAAYSRLLLLFVPISGTLPLALTMARPELPIAIILLLIIAIGLKQKKSITNLFAIWLLPACLISLHPKGVFFFPIFAYVAIEIFIRRNIKILYYSWLISLGVTGYFHYKIIFSCTENNNIGKLLGSFNILLDSSKLTLSNFIAQGLTSVLTQLGGLFRENILRGDNWTGIPKYLGNVNVIVIVIFLSSLFIFLYSTLNKTAERIIKKGKMDPVGSITVLLLFCFLSYCWLQRLYLFYYANFSSFILITMGIMNIPKITANNKNKIILSVLILNAFFTTYTCSSWIYKNKFYTIGREWENVLPANIKKLFADSMTDSFDTVEIREVAKKCKIEFSDRLIIDETTYLALKDHPLPVMTEYIWGNFQKQKTSIEELKQQNHYNGIIARCDRLPEQIKSFTTRYNKFCCGKL